MMFCQSRLVACGTAVRPSLQPEGWVKVVVRTRSYPVPVEVEWEDEVVRADELEADEDEVWVELDVVPFVVCPDVVRLMGWICRASKAAGSSTSRLEASNVSPRRSSESPESHILKNSFAQACYSLR